MTRLITRHALRRVTSPSPLWTLSAPDLPDFLPMCTYIPGDAQMVPGLENYSGRLSYEKKITCAGTLRILLHGVDGQAQVSLDGSMIAEGSGCITTLVEDIPYEQHVLRVDVTGGSGLIRPVTIEQMGSAYITALQITPRQQGRIWLCDISVTLQSLCDEAKPFELELTAGPARTRWEDQELPARASVTLKRTVPAPGAKRWSPARPQLYAASCVLWLDGEPADDIRDRFGFRTAEIAGNSPVINGKTFDGALMHRDDHCGLTGRTVPSEAIVRDVQLLRAMGCVAVRTGDDRRFLDACDEIGLCVLADKAIGNHPCIIVNDTVSAMALPRFADTEMASDGILDQFRQTK